MRQEDSLARLGENEVPKCADPEIQKLHDLLHEFRLKLHWKQNAAAISRMRESGAKSERIWLAADLRDLARELKGFAERIDPSIDHTKWNPALIAWLAKRLDRPEDGQ